MPVAQYIEGHRILCNGHLKPGGAQLKSASELEPGKGFAADDNGIHAVSGGIADGGYSGGSNLQCI